MAVRYMGSKKALAPEISQFISDQHPKATVLDVFAGMCAVGTELVSRHALYTNDIHLYATTYASALFVRPRVSPTSITARAELLPTFRRNRRSLEECVSRRLRLEDKMVLSGDEEKYWKQHIEILTREIERPAARKLYGLKAISEYRANRNLFPYCLFTSYFAGAYFGLRQAIEIDSLRFAIDQAPDEHREAYLAALMEAASHCASAPGHFAQFLVPRDVKTVKYINRMRRRSILGRFMEALDTFPRPICAYRRQNRVYNADATVLLKAQRRKFASKNLVIYADPPYSRAQYSRYYHLLETLVRYDYPKCTAKGRYREDRVQTDFSQKGSVVKAMTEFAAAAAETGAALYLSYPRNGLLQEAGEDLKGILKQSFSLVKVVVKRPLQHSTMGAAPGDAQHRVWEDVFYASN